VKSQLSHGLYLAPDAKEIVRTMGKFQ